jgi:hypothetical protein
MFRALYQIFYKKSGGALNKMRMVGALLCLIGLVANVSIFGKGFI